MSDFLLPDVGEGLVEAEVVSWRVAAGDTVAVNDVVCEIETAKSVVELPSPFAGIVEQLLVPEGETVQVGTPIIRIGSGSDPAPGLLVGYGPRPPGETRRRRRQPPLSTRPVSTRPAPPAPREAAAEGGARRDPVRGVRKAMAASMTTSATIPQATVWMTIDATTMVQWCAARRSDPAYDGVRVSPLLPLAGAVIAALRRHPLLNSVWRDDGVELRPQVNLGIAAATPRGLLVPNIKDADRMSLPDLGRAINQLADVARDGTTTPAAQAGGTFTITNIGPFGVEGGTPLLNPGESGILSLGAVVRRPWVVGEGLAIRDVCTLSLSFDHRHVDGAEASAFLSDVASGASRAPSP